MKVDIVEKLERNRTGSQLNAGKIESEVGLLMSPDKAQERDALRLAGLTMHVREVEHAKGIEMGRQSHEEQYGSKVFKDDEIKDLCVKYDLRMLKANLFAGKIDDDVAAKLAKFIEAHKQEIGNYSADNFYIMAPGSSFQLEDRPVKVRNIDPVLLYKIPNDQSSFVFVHKWGADFTVWRRFRGYFFESVSNMFTVTFSLNFLLVSMLYGYMSSSFTGTILQHLHFLWIGVIALIMSITTLGITYLEMEDWAERETGYLWNRNTKRR